MDTIRTAGEYQGSQEGIRNAECVKLQSRISQYTDDLLISRWNELTQDTDTRDGGQSAEGEREDARGAELCCTKLREMIPSPFISFVDGGMRVLEFLYELVHVLLVLGRRGTRRAVAALPFLVEGFFSLRQFGLGPCEGAPKTKLLRVVSFGHVDLDSSLDDQRNQN